MITTPFNGAVLDPTDESGALLEQYSHTLALRVNEPAMDEVPNAVIVYNYVANTVEVWCTGAEAGDHITMFYGSDTRYSLTLLLLYLGSPNLIYTHAVDASACAHASQLNDTAR